MAPRQSPSAAQVTKTQGSPSELRVDVTVLTLHNLPHIERWLRMKRQFFVSVTDQVTTKKSVSVKIGHGQMVMWNKKLDTFIVRPSSRLTLSLYAKRFLHRDILIGTTEIPLSVGSTNDHSVDLIKDDNSQAGQSTQPVTIHLRINVSPNATATSSSPASTRGPTAAEVGNPPTNLPTTQDTPETDDVATRTKPPPPLKDHIPVGPPITQDAPATAVVPAPTEPLSSRIDYIPAKTNIPASTLADARGETSSSGRARGSGNVTETVRAPGTIEAHRSSPSTSSTTGQESTIEEIINTIERFRILSIGRSGVGKSSLINSVFGIDAAHVENHRPGEADIQQEFVSRDNQFFVLHDSKGFETGDLSNFKTVSEFIQQRSGPETPLKERIHGLWLCTEAPTAGGRVFETGDEKLLQFAHKNQVPTVIVFTQYDRLLRTKEAELREVHPQIDATHLRDLSVEEARKIFKSCLQSLERTMERLKIPMPPYATVSVRPGHKEDLSSLVKVTRDIVKERVKGDAWVMWAIAQRASLPVKIDACIAKGISYYRRTLTGNVPVLGQSLLRDCLREVHEDIITCWNFKGEVLNSPEFRQLMLYLVQDVHPKPAISTSPTDNVISQFVALVTAASAPIAPPVSILGLTYDFVRWLSKTILENTNVPPVQQLLIAYIVDLISVLRELFGITLRRPESALVTTWTELQTAFETYERSPSRQRTHKSVCSKTTRDEQPLTANGVSNKVRELLQEV